ncbi:ArnT family glycosyltransferase [Acetivibrio cellulolyticus]|uniref:ArnT family glycosyltransferase n=1 Tax=Acetivibrio cellulolyticus TaxID=35830 RepID=UPI0001E2C1CD|nr:phospholipid carrier-dependent glycosyltransferase [Acetivibrio cellulolyticus]
MSQNSKWYSSVQLSKHPFIALGLLCLLLNFLFTLNAEKFIQGLNLGLKPIPAMFLVGLFIILSTAIFLKVKGKLTTRNIIILLGITSLLLRVMYIMYTPYYTRQHDSDGIDSSVGHIAYIQHFFNNNFMLPDFDPRTKTQFYHPPLHHFISALWLKFNSVLGMEYVQAVENIQVLTLFYTGCINILCYKIFKEFSLEKLGLIIPFSIVCFHPTLIILSGSINNDVLCLTLMVAAILFTIRWYKNPTTLTIIKIAVSLGLSMMAKSSGFLIAPAIAVVFFFKLWQKRDMFFKLIGQFATFGVICIPLGLWWSVYNFVKYKMPFNAILRLDISPQYLGDCSVITRLFEFNPIKFENIYTGFGNPYRDSNIFIALLKTSVFGEFNLGKKLYQSVIFKYAILRQYIISINFTYLHCNYHIKKVK